MTTYTLPYRLDRDAGDTEGGSRERSNAARAAGDRVLSPGTTGVDHQHGRETQELSALPAPNVVSAQPEPLAYLYQHDETGRTSLRYPYERMVERRHLEIPLCACASLSQAPPEPLAWHLGADMPVSKDERHLRRLLAYRVNMPMAYYDDGEAQGQEHGISIDFMREPVADIDAKLRALNIARAECAQLPQADTVPWPVVTRYSGGASQEGIGGRVWIRLVDDGAEVEYVPAQPKAAECAETLRVIAVEPEPVGYTPADQQRDAAIETELEARGWPANPRNAARAGWYAALKAQPTQAEPANFDAESVRKSFEESFLDYFGRQPEDAVFDKLGEHWLDRTDDGRYEITRVDDAWTGWLAASRRYAHIETLWRVAKLGHEQAFAECQRLSAAQPARGRLTDEQIIAQFTGPEMAWASMLDFARAIERLVRGEGES